MQKGYSSVSVQLPFDPPRVVVHHDDVIKWKHFPRYWPFVHSPVSGEFPAQRAVTRSFDVFFDLRMHERLSKHSWGSRLETPLRPLWRQSYVKLYRCHSLIIEPWAAVYVYCVPCRPLLSALLSFLITCSIDLNFVLFQALTEVTKNERQRLGVECNISHYLNQWWPTPLTHVCVIRLAHVLIWGVDS